jgi:hypothetical protein
MQRYAVFYGEFENEQKFFLDLLDPGFEPHIFSNFPAHDLNFHGREGDEINQNKFLKEIGFYTTVPLIRSVLEYLVKVS